MMILASSSRRALAAAVIAALIGCSSGAGEPGEKGEPGRTAATAASTPEEKFVDPEAALRIFSSELGRLAAKQTLVSPAELAKQADADKACTVATLADPGEKLSPEAIYARARRGVVIVGGISKPKKGGRGHAFCAAGFVLNSDGIIATNQHLLVGFEDMKAVGIMTHDGRVFPIKSVLAADKRNDLAVLKADADGLAPLPLAPNVPIGATVYCLSHPVVDSIKLENAFFAFTQGMVSGKFRLRVADGAPVNVLAVTTDYATGSSGGPILNDHGAVVGMACQTLPIFHDQFQREPQMIWKFGRPTSSILALLRGQRPKEDRNP